MKTLIDKNEQTTKYLVTDSQEEDRFVHVTEQDVSPVIELAKAHQEHGKWDSEMKPVAEIPMVVVERMMQDGSWGDPAAMKRWLNDPQNDCFRIWRGRV